MKLCDKNNRHVKTAGLQTLRRGEISYSMQPGMGETLNGYLLKYDETGKIIFEKIYCLNTELK